MAGACRVYNQSLGSGSFGEVYLEETYYLQEMQLKVRIVAKKVALFPSESESLHNEAQVLALLSHPHIIRSLGTVEKEFEVVHVMEYFQGCHLNQVAGIYANIRCIRDVFVQSLSTVEYLQASNIVHRDLGAHNILFNGTTLKVIDFEFAGPPGDACKSPEGMVSIQPPEVLNEEVDDLSRDMFAVCCLLYELCCQRELACYIETPKEIANYYREGLTTKAQWKANISDPVILSILSKVLIWNSVERISAAQAASILRGGASLQ